MCCTSPTAATTASRRFPWMAKADSAAPVRTRARRLSTIFPARPHRPLAHRAQPGQRQRGSLSAGGRTAHGCGLRKPRPNAGLPVVHGMTDVSSTTEEAASSSTTTARGFSKASTSACSSRWSVARRPSPPPSTSSPHQRRHLPRLQDSSMVTSIIRAICKGTVDVRHPPSPRVAVVAALDALLAAMLGIIVVPILLLGLGFSSPLRRAFRRTRNATACSLRRSRRAFSAYAPSRPCAAKPPDSAPLPRSRRRSVRGQC